MEIQKASVIKIPTNLDILRGNMLELLKLTPNILAQIMSSFEYVFYSNVIYSFGYLIFIHHNIQINDPFQIRYFVFMECAAVFGVLRHLWKKRKANVTEC